MFFQNGRDAHWNRILIKIFFAAPEYVANVRDELSFFNHIFAGAILFSLEPPQNHVKIKVTYAIVLQSQILIFLGVQQNFWLRGSLQKWRGLLLGEDLRVLLHGLNEFIVFFIDVKFGHVNILKDFTGSEWFKLVHRSMNPICLIGEEARVFVIQIWLIFLLSFECTISG